MKKRFGRLWAGKPVAILWVVVLCFACRQKLHAQQEYRKASDSATIASLIRTSMDIQFHFPDSALALSREALSLSRQSQNKDFVMRSLISLGACLHNVKADYPAAKACFLEALTYVGKVPVSDRVLTRLYNNLGNAYIAENKHDTAVQYYFKSLDVQKRQKKTDTQSLMLSYGGIGGAFAEMGKLKLALHYLSLLEQLAQRAGDTGLVAAAYTSIGNAYGNQKTSDGIDSAVKYFRKSLPLYLSLGRKGYAFTTYLSLGQSSVDKGRLEEARRYYDSALVLDRDQAFTTPDFFKGVGGLEYMSGHYREAIPYLKKALLLSKETGSRQNRLDILDYLTGVYRQLGDYQQAFAYQSDYVRLRDSTMNEEMVHAISQMEVRYRTAEKDRELVESKLQLALAQARLSHNQSLFIGIVAAVLLIIILMVIVFQKQRLQLQKAKVSEQEQKVEQLKAVIEGEERERSRIGRQLHDDIMVELSIVKMGLNALPIQYPDIKHSGSYANLVHQLDHTSRKLRLSAHNLMPDALLTEGLIPAISYFCNNITRMTGLRIHFQHYGDIPRLSADMEISIYRIVQELVQNTIKHAKATNTLVQLNCREDIISITVEDDGVGFSNEQDALENKMGLKSIQMRLKALNGIIDIHTRNPQGTSVNVSFTLVSDDKK
ncbi:tetratricopeptide repeat-containing sensor histidine kinase [Taibaiella helva]|uniref:tetratricopeptide repeat-containing sensor histidine kinase n=1 Tax=Taibaiella helva TaxID=2301235 RepID=UPI000E59470E|nr:ATP-binding protein [Taibaiella helva]